MGVNVLWDNEEKTIIRQDYQGPWTWNEFFQACAQSAGMMREVTHRVDLVADLKQGIMPRSGSSISFARKVLNDYPANWGGMIIIVNPYIGALVSVFKQFDRKLGAKVNTAPSLDAARKMILTLRA